MISIDVNQNSGLKFCMSLCNVTKYMEKLYSDKPKFFSEIITFIKILVIAPETIGEMPVSCLRRP